MIVVFIATTQNYGRSSSVHEAKLIGFGLNKSGAATTKNGFHRYINKVILPGFTWVTYGLWGLS